DPTPDEPALPRFAATMRDVVAGHRVGQNWAERAAQSPPPENNRTSMKLDRENLTVTADAATPLTGLSHGLSARGYRCALPARSISGELRTIGAVVSGDTHRPA